MRRTKSAPAATGDDAASAPNKSAAREMLSVSQLTHIIEAAIKTGVPSTVLVQGELSNVNLHRGSGHLYFTLKDANSCIDGVMWKSELAKLKFDPTDGEDVIITGSVAVYGARGRYQLYARKIEPMGRGALEVAFRQLHAKLEAEGLFSPDRKRPLPRYPMRIAMLTSRDGAALQDMLKVLRRFPWLKLTLTHVPVQGDGAGARIALALNRLSAKAASGAIDLILVARGGGSLEDLWAFNEEAVARAIAGSFAPVVTGIGHEVDTTIADLVADYHAHTPTEAAQIVTASWRTIVDELDAAALRLRRGLRASVQDARQRLNGIERHEAFRRPLDRINQLRMRLDDRQRGLVQVLIDCLRRCERELASRETRLRRQDPRHRIELLNQKLNDLNRRLLTRSRARLREASLKIEKIDAQLTALSPQAVLRRGYSITTIKRGGAVVRSIEQLKPGDAIITRVTDGEIESTVEDQTQPKLFE
ncbi:MAG: exodeoxyribonuclease VII large subunit [Anaerolineae bacterium]|nr:exodeoxyribonuclease VII large subunit [Phycisphaerae bacterium]